MSGTNGGVLRDALAAHGIALVGDLAPVSGGDICDAWHAQTPSGPLFVKTLAPSAAAVLQAEASGLDAIADTHTLRVPRVIGHGQAADVAWLALEWLELSPGDSRVQHALGTQLAALHQHTASRHGWHTDNWIGRTPQPNAWCADWTAFFAEHRLQYQLELAERAGFGGAFGKPGADLLERLPELLAGHTPEASLLHGDLWGGNWGTCDDAPVVYDPAVYYGDREADLAMTRLFGGFGSAFYEAYEAAWPLPPGHRQRDALYRLYHVLNHVNLFGGGYVHQASNLIDGLLRAHR